MKHQILLSTANQNNT